VKDLIKKLSGLRGISGFEYRINGEIEKQIAPYCDEVKRDALGNVIAVKYSKKPNAKKLLVEAHIDESGLWSKTLMKKAL
ncbi:MAG: hypothetical protein IKR46_02910, partial [Clostridia bacterium]|nr:hypothetical protein [Clostridia bacterium]